MADGEGELGRQIRNARKAAGLRTYADFADATGLAPRTLGAIERGEHSGHREDTFAVIEDALGWVRGSCERVLHGGQPVRVKDAELDRLLHAWPRLPVETRRVLARLAEDALRRE